MKKLILAAALSAFSASGAMAFEISSDSIENGRLKTESACTKMGGADVSPAVTITDVPEGANYLAIIMDDPDAQSVAGKTWVHWNVLNIPVSDTTFAAGAAVNGDVLANSSGANAYEGMCPPNGRHNYRLAAFALKDKIDTSKLGELTVEKMREQSVYNLMAVSVVEGNWSGPEVKIGVQTLPEPGSPVPSNPEAGN